MKFLMTYAQNPSNPPPTPAKMAEIGAYAEKNLKSGVVLMTGGLVRPSRGIHLLCEGGKTSVTDGPFAETKELIAGYTIIEVKSREEALEWSRRYPNPAGKGRESEIEVRQFYELEDFDAPEEVERFNRLMKERR